MGIDTKGEMPQEKARKWDEENGSALWLTVNYFAVIAGVLFIAPFGD
jgi:hypothetical protein